jgi:uncharacterized protein (TIGR00730 family)
MWYVKYTFSMQQLAHPFQTLSEAQYVQLQIIENEYKTGMLALNSLGAQTVTFYGGSLIQMSDLDYIAIKEIAAYFGSKGWGVVSGGGPGIMSAALDGAKMGGGEAIGFCIDIPGEPQNQSSSLSLVFTQFSVRKYLLRQSDVFIFAPGGIGTLDELMEVLTLIKTGKFPLKPIFLYNSVFWKGYLDWFKQVLMTERKVVAADLLDLFHLVDSKEEAIQMFEP